MKVKDNLFALEPLTRDEIMAKLKSMVVGQGDVLPIRSFSIITKNMEYKPDSFSKEIEESETKIDWLGLVSEEIKKEGFDFVWNNTLSKLPRNSKEWRDNHRMICPILMHPCALTAACVNHEDGTRDYYSEEIVGRLLEFGNEHGEILDFV